MSAALDLGSDVNAVNPAGDTALHIASAQGFDTVVRLLAERGADLNIRNSKGQTPLGALLGRGPNGVVYPVRSPRPKTVDLLRSLGAVE